MVVILQATLYTAAAVLGALSNSMVIVIWIGNPDLRKSKSSYFILNQSVIDALTSIFLGISYRNIVVGFGYTPHTYQDDSITDRFLCKFWDTDKFLWALIASSTFNLVILTAERYFKIVHPFTYSTFYRKWKMVVALALPWILGFVYQIAFYYTASDVKDNQCQTGTLASKAMRKSAGIATFMLQFFIPIVIMVFCYVRILMAIRKGQQMLKNYGKSSEMDDSNKKENMGAEASDGVANEAYVGDAQGEQSSTFSQGSSKVAVSFSLDTKAVSIQMKKQKPELLRKKWNLQTKLIKTLIFICVAFFVCWVWNQVAFFLANVGIIEFKALIRSPFYVFSVIMAYVNCIINPFIYVLQFKKYIPRLACSGCH